MMKNILLIEDDAALSNGIKLAFLMIRVDNKKTIKHVADTSFKADKMRNTFAIIAKYLNRMISHDFVIGDVSWFNIFSRYVNQDTLKDSFLEELSAYGGIESLEKIYFSEDKCRLDEHWDDMAERVNTELGIDDGWLVRMKLEI